MQLPQGASLMLLATATLVSGQRYADNQRPIVRDPPLVAAAFPPVDFELLSPAFLSPETVPAGFADNAAGPTDQNTLGRYLPPRSIP